MKKCLLAAHLAVVGVSTLVSGSLLGFWIYFPNVHEQITRNGLNPYDIETSQDLDLDGPRFELILQNGAIARFSEESLGEIIKHNKETDGLQGYIHGDKHFDNENFAGGSRRLIQLRKEIVKNLVHWRFFDYSTEVSAEERKARVTNARALFGTALHTLQDFYSHSNWVETRSNFLINPDLGNKTLKSTTPNERCYLTSPPSGTSYALSSGWYDESDSCWFPVLKCAHGDFDELCGMNKDASHRPGHAVARELATKATSTFARETLQGVLATYTRLVPTLGEAGAKQAVRLAVCEFMGVDNPMSTCLTSHTVTVQKLDNANGQPTLGGLVQSSGDNITPAIDCGLLCEGTAIAGSTVLLTAKKSGNWRFVRWSQSGVCPGSTNSQCNVTVDGDKIAKAEFTNLQFVDWTSIDTNSRIVSGTLGSTAVTFSWTADGSVGATWFNEDFSGFSDAAFTPSVGSMDGLEFTGRKLPEPTPTYTITFSTPVTNPLLHIASNASTLTFIGSTPTRVSGDERLSVNGNQVIGVGYNSPNGTDGNGTVMFSGTFSSLTFTAQFSDSGPIDGIALQVGIP